MLLCGARVCPDGASRERTGCCFLHILQSKALQEPGGFSGVAEKGACEPGAATAILSPGGGGEGTAEESGTDNRENESEKESEVDESLDPTWLQARLFR